MEQKKQPNITLIIGILIPVVMIIATALAVYLPGFIYKPKTNFLYTAGKYPEYGSPNFKVQDKKLAYDCEKQVYYGSDFVANDKCKEEFMSTLYIYDVETEKSTKVSYAEAQKLTLNSNAKSKDGYEVGQYYGGDIFSSIFGGHEYDYNSWYLKGHNTKYKIKAETGGESYYNFRFIGWLEE